MNDYKNDLIKLLTSTNSKAKLIGLVALIPIGISAFLPIVLNEKLSIADKVILLSSGLSGGIVSLGLAAVKPNDIIDKDNPNGTNQGINK